MFRRRFRLRSPSDPSVPDRCMAAGCRRANARRCTYVDKRSRGCTTWWCVEHGASERGQFYCRRHASTIAALHGGHSVAGLPDLDNRAPSLVEWVSRDLDEPIRAALARLAPEDGATLVADPVRLVLAPGNTSRRWTRTWKLLDHASVISRVSVEVDESRDDQVAARVDAAVIGNGVPPWIEHRRSPGGEAGSDDVEERRRFTRAMAQSIEMVVTKQQLLPRY